MKWNLPRLTWELDCEPLGCPGVKIVFWLNADIEMKNVPSWSKVEGEEKQREALKKAPAWDNWFYYQILHCVDWIVVPAQYLKDAEGETRVTFASAQEVWEFEHAPGFDPQILQWALKQYSAQRQARLQAEAKN